MKKLPEILKKWGFLFELVIRDENIALYSQSNGGAVIAHELFKIQKATKSYKIWDTEFPPKEFYPGHENFGSTAWSITKNKIEAIEQFKQLQKNIKKK